MTVVHALVYKVLLVSLVGDIQAAQTYADGAAVVNVRDFGAKGDGVTDDIMSVQRAVANLTNGGIVFFPPGAYAISAPIVLSNVYSVVLRGSGKSPTANRGSSLLALTSDSTLVVFNRTSTCRLEHMLLSHASKSGAHVEIDASAVNTAHLRRVQALGLDDKTALRTSDIKPTSGSAVVVHGAFDTDLANLWIVGVWQAVVCSHEANTITVLDSIVLSIYGPYAFFAGGVAPGKRVDILQMSRITTNQQNLPGENASAVWIEIGSGVNTVRLDNVGLINGGNGIRMDAPADDPAGQSPGRGLFLLTNDLEIDFPIGNAIELMRGESAVFSNAYIQGSKTANGIYVAPSWNSEVQVTNSRFFGHHMSGVQLAGGVRTLFSNNIIGDNSQAGEGIASGVTVRQGVKFFSFTGNHIGPVTSGEAMALHKYGIEIETGPSDAYTVTGNIVIGNSKGGIFDGGSGKQKAVANNAGCEAVANNALFVI